MLVAEAVNTNICILSTDQSVMQALQKMDELEVDVLPVQDTENSKIIGQISREMLEANCSEDARLSTLELAEPVVIYNSQHLFHAIRLMLKREMTLLAVVNKKNEFQGTIQKKQVLELLVHMLNLTGYGSIITIELDRQDFTLSEIVQLIETEGGKILGLTVESPDGEHENYSVSIKLNLKDVSHIASALRRYGYTIITEEKNKPHNVDLEMRVDEFLQYLDM